MKNKFLHNQTTRMHMRTASGTVFDRAYTWDFSRQTLTGFNQAGALTPTFARTTAATYVDPNTGLLTTAAIDAPRFETMPGGGVGMRFDPTRTNSCKQSRTLSTSPWNNAFIDGIAQNAVGMDGVTNTAWTLTDSNATASRYISQAVPIPNDSGYVLWQVGIKKDTNTTRFPVLQITMTGGTVVSALVIINTQTGECGVTPTSNIAYCGVSSYNADYWLLYAVLKNNSSGNTFTTAYLLPAYGSSLTTVDPTRTGSAVFDCVDCHIGATYPSSPIVTGASSVQRTADSLTYPNLVAPANHAVLIDVVPAAGLPVGAPTAFNLVTFNGTGGAATTSRTVLNAAGYDLSVAGGGGYILGWKTVDISTTARNRILWWARGDANTISVDFYLNGVLKANPSVTATGCGPGAAGAMDLTTQFGGYSTSALGGWLANAVILNNPTAEDVYVLAEL